MHKILNGLYVRLCEQYNLVHVQFFNMHHSYLSANLPYCH